LDALRLQLHQSRSGSKDSHSALLRIAQASEPQAPLSKTFQLVRATEANPRVALELPSSEVETKATPPPRPQLADQRLTKSPRAAASRLSRVRVPPSALRPEAPPKNPPVHPQD